jgi:hypothetical protein
MYPNREFEHTYLVVAEMYDVLKEMKIPSYWTQAEYLLMKVIIFDCFFVNLLRLLRKPS